MTEVLSVSAEVVAAIFGIAVTVVAIIVQLAATRFNHQITTMFLRDRINIAMQALFLLTTLVCIWIATLAEVPQWVALLALACVTVSVLLLLPYFAYVFTFISPLNVIRRIAAQARRGVLRRRPDLTLGALNHLQDVARSGVETREGSIVLACTDALVELFEFHQRERADLPADWFGVDGVEADPDFVSFEPSALQDLDKSGLWFESKIIQQLLNMMWLTVPEMRAGSTHLGIALRRLAIASADRPELLALSLRGLNSCLRVAINARDARTSYHLLSQYRSVAEHLLDKRADEAAVTAAVHIGAYGRLACEDGQPFILEVAAFDMAALIRHAHQRDAEASAVVFDLLREFLQLDQEILTATADERLLGVRRVQMQAAAYFIAAGESRIVDAIVDDLRDENHERLRNIAQGLREETRALFWEFTPRGANFSYLDPDLRPHLDDLLARVDGDSTSPQTMHSDV